MKWLNGKYLMNVFVVKNGDYSIDYYIHYFLEICYFRLMNIVEIMYYYAAKKSSVISTNQLVVSIAYLIYLVIP